MSQSRENVRRDGWTDGRTDGSTDGQTDPSGRGWGSNKVVFGMKNLINELMH